MGHAKLVFEKPEATYPPFLKRVTKVKSHGSDTQDAPLLVRMNEKNAATQLESIIKAHKDAEVLDNYGEQYAELLLSKNAHLYRANYNVQVSSIRDLLVEHYKGHDSWELGTWVYFPWKNQLVHILAQEEFETLRTIRNRELITAEEQQKLLGCSVAAFGMSVGSAGALALTISGIARRVKLVDGAVISGSNLNRILTGVSSVGKSKALVIGRQIYEMNPYSTIVYFDKVNRDNIDTILDKPWDVNIVVDEIDDIAMKVRIRYEARERRIPVVMATELGDTIMLDVERFDREPQRPLFHGMLPGIEQLLDSPIGDYREWTKRAVSIIDPTNMSIKMQKSLLKIGTSVVTHPQLGSTVMMTGGVLAFAVKNIILGGALESGRYVISLEEAMLADHKTWRYRRLHKKHTRLLRRSVNAM